MGLRCKFDLHGSERMGRYQGLWFAILRPSPVAPPPWLSGPCGVRGGVVGQLTLSTHEAVTIFAAMENEIIDLLRTVSVGFQRRMQEQIAGSGLGLTTFQARLVNIVGRRQDVTQLDLASVLDRDKAQIARAAKELEGRGLVTRRAHASDWRSKCLALTPEGKRVHASLSNMRQQVAADILAQFSEQEKQDLRTLLEKMGRAFP